MQAEYTALKKTEYPQHDADFVELSCRNKS
jgi:hypothetical protein